MNKIDKNHTNQVISILTLIGYKHDLHRTVYQIAAHANNDWVLHLILHHVWLEYNNDAIKSVETNYCYLFVFEWHQGIGKSTDIGNLPQEQQQQRIGFDVRPAQSNPTAVWEPEPEPEREPGAGNPPK